jgi:hypothetical protein
MRRACILTTVLALLGCQGVLSRELQANDLEELAIQAVSDDGLGAEAAIAELRARGPAGLDALFAVHAAATRQANNKPSQATQEKDSAWQRVRHALDNVSGQRDCHAARLFWYTDFAEAHAAANQAHKPILSLRLLGKLTDEFSCANSRFFRSTLYSNKEVAQMLRERFVLHWQTVRPAPIVTIDFGDGRKLLRTVTGNSVHYVLSADGQPLDALPGLYGPQAFMRCLERADELARAVMADDADKATLVAQYHGRRSAELQQAWQRDLEQLGISQTADQGQRLPPEDLSDSVWSRVAVLHASDAQLDAASRRLIASQHPVAAKAARVAMTKSAIEDPLVRLVRDLQGTIALDTVRNEHLLHRRIHDWFAAGQVVGLEPFNERVYAKLFLTPSSDPWLGLLPSAYTALDNDGVVVSAKH